MRRSGTLCLQEVVGAVRGLRTAVARVALEEARLCRAGFWIGEASAVHRGRGRDWHSGTGVARVRGVSFVEGRAARRDGGLRRLRGNLAVDGAFGG
jgi:hypothetical protein